MEFVVAFSCAYLVVMSTVIWLKLFKIEEALTDEQGQTKED